MEDILVARQKGNRVKLKIAKWNRNKYAEPIYRKILNPHDSNDLALFFGDLKLYFNSPIDNAFKILKKEEEELGKGFWVWGKSN